MAWFTKLAAGGWARALLLLLLAIVGAVHSVRLSASYVFASTQPMLSIAIGGVNADAVGRLASAEHALAQGKRPLREERRRQLLAGLRFDPLSRRAIGALGLDADAAGDKERAKRLMRASGAISRRDNATQLWLVRDAAERRDWATAFRHLDAAISTSESTWQQLFPLLVQGLAYPEVRAAMQRPLQQGRFWAVPFLTYAIENSPNPEHVRRLLRESGPLARDAELGPLKAKLVTRFASLGRIDEASHFAREALDADRRILENIAITSDTLNPLFVPLTWQIIQQSNIATTPDPESGSIYFSAGPGPRAVPFTRHLVLEPGRYSFSFVAAAPPTTEEAQSEWGISCIRGNQPVLIATAPVSTKQKGENAVLFDLPPGCPGAVFSLVILGNIEGAEAAISIAEISLARLH